MTRAASGEQVRVLVDTDIGTDIDDALTLAYLLANPDCDLLGITTVTGEAHRRASLASVLCTVAGRDVPIYPGVERPLLLEQRERFAPQAEILARWPHQSAFPRGEAIEFMRHTVHANPGEVVLLGIGPMTNIGLLFAVDPEIPSLLKGLQLMSGKFAGFPTRATGAICSAFVPSEHDLITCAGALEANACIDPHATAVVYGHATPRHRSVGIDITRQVTMPADQFRKVFTHPLHQPIKDMAAVWWQEWEELVTFHDPLAAVSLFSDSVVSYARGIVTVELASSQLQGYTFWQEDAGGPHEVAVAVDKGAFLEAYLGVFNI